MHDCPHQNKSTADGVNVEILNRLHVPGGSLVEFRASPGAATQMGFIARSAEDYVPCSIHGQHRAGSPAANGYCSGVDQT